MTQDPSSSANQRAIDIQGVRKAFGANAVLNHVDLSLATGEVLTLLGPNGSGKTTLMKILATLIKPSSGRGRVEGFDLLTEVEPIRQRVGFLAHADKFANALAEGKLVAPAKTPEAMQQIIFNDRLDAGLCLLFLGVVLTVLVYTVRACLQARHQRQAHARETPYQRLSAEATAAAH